MGSKYTAGPSHLSMATFVLAAIAAVATIHESIKSWQEWRYRPVERVPAVVVDTNLAEQRPRSIHFWTFIKTEDGRVFYQRGVGPEVGTEFKTDLSGWKEL